MILISEIVLKLMTSFKYKLFGVFFMVAVFQTMAQEFPVKSIPIPAVEKNDEKKEPEPAPVKIEPIRKEEEPKAESPIVIKKRETEF